MKKLLKNKRFNIITVDILFALLVLFADRLASLMIKSISPCPFAKMGILCPACGGTRCVESFFSGNISKAFGYNAFFTVLIFYTFVVLTLINLYCLFDVQRLKEPIRLMTGYKTIITFAVAFAVFGFVRALANF